MPSNQCAPFLLYPSQCPISKPPDASPPRKTSRRYHQGRGVHFVTFSCYRRLPLLGNPDIRDLFATTLAQARVRHRFQLLAWVVMPEHVHLMLIPTANKSDGSTLASILIAIKKPLASQVVARWKSRDWPGLADITDSRGKYHFWQPGGGFDRNVRDISELQREIVYIHQNPVERGLVTNSTDWPWSSARHYDGWPHQPVEIDTTIIEGREFPGEHRKKYVGDKA